MKRLSVALFTTFYLFIFSKFRNSWTLLRLVRFIYGNLRYPNESDGSNRRAWNKNVGAVPRPDLLFRTKTISFRMVRFKWNAWPDPQIKQIYKKIKTKIILGPLVISKFRNCHVKQTVAVLCFRRFNCDKILNRSNFTLEDEPKAAEKEVIWIEVEPN